ncbi:uncharacterized protein LOC132088296 [Daphnia carinata]|uniref:uncharacterized protein LOC132088296 n=1 Tax=Daphnia carinata TaxID=120202 RepID=UPI00286854F1|nr:uncharacterized protein LOC132088296 [Daphnia carinata]
MNSMRDVNHIAKFNGQNFPLWKLGFWILLQQHELVKIVTGDETIPVENVVEGSITNAEAIAAWHTKDTLARGYIISTIESQQQRSLINCTTANQMWVRLTAQYLRNAVENRYALQTRFFGYRYKPDQDIITHITEIETMATQLTDIGAPVDVIS